MLLCTVTEGVGQASTSEFGSITKLSPYQHPSASAGEKPAGHVSPCRENFHNKVP